MMLPLLSQSKWYGSSMKQRQILKLHDILCANACYRSRAAQKLSGPQLWI
jgi:hypothetical protein